MSQEWSHNMSYGSVVESNSIVREILHENMVRNKAYIHLPTRQQALHEAELFSWQYGPRRNQRVARNPRYNFPKILVFMIDGTHIELGRCIDTLQKLSVIDKQNLPLMCYAQLSLKKIETDLIRN